jgi:ATP synthase protein I
LDVAAMKKAKGPGLLLISVGSLLTSMIVAGFLLGYGVDVLLNTQPVFLLSFGLLGFVGGILKVYKILIDPELH